MEHLTRFKIILGQFLCPIFHITITRPLAVDFQTKYIIHYQIGIRIGKVMILFVNPCQVKIFQKISIMNQLNFICVMKYQYFVQPKF